MFTLDTLTWLASDAGAAVLRRLASDDLSDDNTLRLLTLLRRDLAPERAGAALELARLRVKAVGKFGVDAGKMFFTRDALEQATDPLIRKQRSGKFQDPPIEDQMPIPMLDVCCSIGSDAFALAEISTDVVGYDIDPVRIFMARLNAAALGVNVRFEVADVTQVPLKASNIFFDPARRDAQGKRIFDVEQYLPPLALTKRFECEWWTAKLSPGVELAQLDPYRQGSWVSFISVNGELKEVELICEVKPRLWSGKATEYAILFSDDKRHVWLKEREIDPVIQSPRQWLVEPDPALIRAGLVADAALKFGGAQLDESIAYFTTDDKPESPWVRAWRILDWMPFNGKKLREYLRERGVGTVTVKKRGTAVTPEALIPQLKLKGSESRTLVLTRYAGKQIVLICEDISP